LPRLSSQATEAARYAVRVARAPVALRACTSVGPWARVAGGAPAIENAGRIELGAHVLLNSSFSPVRLSTGPAGAITIGERTVINFGTSVSALERVTIGANVSIGPNCILSDSPLETAHRGDVTPAPVTLGDGAWLAGQVTLLPGAEVGAGSVITAGSIVQGVIPPGVIAGGIPARVLRQLTPGEPTPAEATSPAPAGASAVSAASAPASAAAPAPAAKSEATPAAGPGCLVPPTSGKAGRPADAKSLRATVISDFTVDDYAWRLTEDLALPYVDAEVAPFGQVVPSLLGLAAQADAPELAVVWTRPQSVSPAFQRALEYDALDAAALSAEVDAFADLLLQAAQKVRCLLVPTWTVPAFNRGWGLTDGRANGLTRALTAMNLRLMERLGDVANVFVLNTQRWVEVGGKHAQNPKLWYMGKVAYSAEVLDEAVRDTKAALTAITGGARKLVVVDLDDTMWGGIVGDAGWENLRLGGHDAVGESFVEFQRALKALKRRGIVLAIASKNEESVALEAIRKHPEMVLKEDDFVAWRINWNDKAANIASIAKELNLGLQSVVFLDDNPVERGRVREQLPEVLVPDWPEDKLLYTSTLLSLGCFDTPTLTREDLERTSMYIAERKRSADVAPVGNMTEWLASLGIRVTASGLNAANLARTTQLLNKTNQLNLTTRRLTEPELEAWVKGEGRDLYVVSVADKYGDSGLTGIVSTETRDGVTSVVDYVLSCRVMGRKVEETLVHLAVQAAQRRGAKVVGAQLIPTKKNKPCLDFWKERSGFTAHEEHRFTWDTGQPYPCPETITLSFER
jgi:FkbH-like protein